MIAARLAVVAKSAEIPYTTAGSTHCHPANLVHMQIVLIMMTFVPAVITSIKSNKF